MKKLFVLVFFSSYFLFAQDIDSIGTLPSVESQAYHEYRLKNSIPFYNLSKIQNMVSKLEPVPVDPEMAAEGDIVDYYVSLSDKDFNKLSDKEKFTYTMIHPEYMSQVCADEMTILDEDKKIFGYLCPTFDESSWSERQRSFLNSNRKVVINLIKEISLKDQHIGLNCKMALEEINATEIIPFLVDFYNTKGKKDRDILTLLLTLVKNNKYYPFTRSNVYRELYGDDKSYYDSYIEYTELNEEYIIKSAKNFYVKLYNSRTF
ncbi:MAG: hypothetical protein LBQ84_09910 [Flavobacteriaceae bacterium]|nr:hypothetical protein [Flavobacteriaceae bacterium]